MGLAVEPRAIEAQVDCSRAMEDSVALPCLVRADLAYPEIFSVGPCMDRIRSITKRVTLAIAMSDECCAAETCRYISSLGSMGWNGAPTARHAIAAQYKLVRVDGVLLLQTSIIWVVLTCEASVDVPMA